MKTKVLDRIKTRSDQEVRVEHIWVGGEEIFRIADFVPSTKTEGQGVAMTLDTLTQLHEKLGRVLQYHGIGQGRPGEGQGVLL